MTLLGSWLIVAYIALGYVVLAFASAANDTPDDETLEDVAPSMRQPTVMDEGEDDVKVPRTVAVSRALPS